MGFEETLLANYNIVEVYFKDFRRVVFDLSLHDYYLIKLNGEEVTFITESSREVVNTSKEYFVYYLWDKLDIKSKDELLTFINTYNGVN